MRLCDDDALEQRHGPVAVGSRHASDDVAGIIMTVNVRWHARIRVDDRVEGGRGVQRVWHDPAHALGPGVVDAVKLDGSANRRVNLGSLAAFLGRVARARRPVVLVMHDHGQGWVTVG